MNGLSRFKDRAKNNYIANKLKKKIFLNSFTKYVLDPVIIEHLPFQDIESNWINYRNK